MPVKTISFLSEPHSVTPEEKKKLQGMLDALHEFCTSRHIPFIAAVVPENTGKTYALLSRAHVYPARSPATLTAMQTLLEMEGSDVRELQKMASSISVTLIKQVLVKGGGVVEVADRDNSPKSKH